MIEFTDINKNLPNGQNMGGVQQAIYFCFHADVETFPTKQVTPATLEENASLTGNIIMKAGKRMFEMYITDDTGEFKVESVGEVDGKSFVLHLSLFHPGMQKKILGFINAAKNDNLASVKLVMQLDKDFPEPEIHSHKKRIPIPLTKELAIKNMNFSFPGGEQLFKNFNEIIPAFQLTGIIGESGRGKTTFMDLIAGLQNPLSGEICVDGQVLNQKILPRWRTGIGYLPQDSFFIDATLRENLVWDSHRNISDEEIESVLEQVNALHLVRRFKKGLEEDLVNYQFHFSGGERQRLALARVLLRKPQILLLDEATSSLDADNEKQIMDLLAALKNRVTILFVTHRTSVLPWFDKVIKIGE